MTEYSSQNGNLQGFYIGRGFSTLRLAVGGALEQLATDLETVREQDYELEVRHPNPSAQARRRGDRRPAVQIVSGRDVRSLNVPRPDVLLADVYDELDETVPELLEPMERVCLTEAYDIQVDTGLFFVTALDEETVAKLKLQRSAILSTVLRMGGVQHPRRLNMPDPDITIGFLGEAAGRDTLDATYEVIDAHLPLEITLLPAARHPQYVG